jgi:hypothetical protein
LAPALLVAICIAFCWKLVLSPDYTWIDNPDVTQMDVPRLQFQHETFTSGRFPLWDPHLWCGQPFLGQIVGAAFPLNWPLFLIPTGPTGKISLTQLNWYFVLLHILAALAAYALCRDLGCSRNSSILGGFLYSFDGIIGSTLWPEVLGSLILAPLVLLYLLRALRRDRPYANAALCGMFLGATWLAGHHEVPIYLGTTVAGIWIYDLVRARADRRRALALGLVTFVFAALTSGFQTVPGYEYAREAVRWVGIDHPVTWNEPIPYRIHESNSLYPSSIVGMVVPRGGGNPEAFIGIAALALAVVAVCAAWRSRHVKLITCVALAGLFLAFGGYNLLHGVAYGILPVFGKARIPYRILVIFDLGVAVLAATGLDALAARISISTLRAIRWTLVIFATVVVTTGFVLAELAKGSPSEAFYIAALSALALAALLSAHHGSQISTRVLRAVIFILVFFELGNHLPNTLHERTAAESGVAGKLSASRDIGAFLRGTPGVSRVYADRDPFNFGDWEGIDTLTGFGAGVTANVLALEWPNPRIQNLLAVNYSVTREAPRPDQELVFRAANGASVLKNRDALPRVRMVHRIEEAASAAALHKRLQNPSFDLGTTAIMTAPVPHVDSCQADEHASIRRRTANAVAIDAEPFCRGMLILADTWYPGWDATIDGRPTPIHEVYGALRGVIVPPGPHHIEFHYRPMTAWIGAACSLLGIAGACVMAAMSSRKGRPPLPGAC